MSELTDATAALTALISHYGQTRDELVAAMTTPADGGQSGDGTVNITLPNGDQVRLQSLMSVIDRTAEAIDVLALNRLIAFGKPGDTVILRSRR